MVRKQKIQFQSLSFHVQKLAYDAVQEARIKYRWEALDAESKAIEEARRNKRSHQPEVFSNGDTLKQLLARSRYLLFKLFGLIRFFES